jgi:hypothetical protein
MKNTDKNTELPQCDKTDVRHSLPLTNQQLWDMAKVIVEKQKIANDSPKIKIDWEDLEEDWFHWLEDSLFSNDA